MKVVPGNRFLKIRICIISLFFMSFMGSMAFSQGKKPDVPNSYQQFFKHYIDKRSYIEKALNFVGLTNNEMGRSFALIAGVSSYPNMKFGEKNLKPAAEDISKLQQYLKTYEYFDEIIVLKDSDMNSENLKFFLQDYFPKRLKKFPKSRFLFAYSGHGFTYENRSYLVESNAKNLSDIGHSIAIESVRVLLNPIIDSGHHVLVLLNACFSGSFLKRSFGNQYYTPTHKGAHAITAGGTHELAWHDPKVGTGSLFFEKFFAGLEGYADILPKNKTGTSGDGIITVGELAEYLKQEIQIFTDQNQNPQSGDISKDGSLGGFFFLSRNQRVQRNEVSPWDPGKKTTSYGPGNNLTSPEALSYFEKKILDEIKKKDFQNAIVATAEYEYKLNSMYDPPTFEMNHFQSEADHLSFHSFFSNWQQISLEELEMPDWLSVAGFNILIALESELGENRFMLMSENLGQVEQRSILLDADKTELTEQEIMLNAKMWAENWGVVKNQEFKTIGNHYALIQNIEMPMGSSPIISIYLANGRRFYSFLLVSSLRKKKKNKEQLFQLIKTVNFDYKPEDRDKIQQIRDQFGYNDEPKAILHCVGKLAAIGEYNEAATEMARLRLYLVKQMPQPYIDGNIAYHPAYGIKIMNPDENNWNLSIEELGSFQMFILEERWSVKEEGIGIIIIDPILAYGPQVTEILFDQDMHKDFLIGAGRGSSLYIGSSIEDEKFTTFRDNLAYEAIVTVNFPGIKAKILWTINNKVILGILMMADINKFEDKTAEYKKIIQGNWIQINN